MKLKNYLILDFSKGYEPIMEVVVPKGSIFQRAKILHDGINGWWAVPEVTINIKTDVGEMETITEVQKFKILRTEESIPAEAMLVDILDNIVETGDGEQGVIVYPLYKYL